MVQKYIYSRNQKIAEKTVQNLQKRFFEAYYVETKEDALKKAIELIPQDSIISWGGSMSVSEIGLTDYIIRNNYNVINRDLAKSPAEKTALLRQALACDVYLMGTNAISKDGQLVNVDSTGNRAAALIFGPKNVIIIAGINKITEDIESAIDRARKYAAPINMQRISELSGRKTPCTLTGECQNCISKDSICSNIVITRLCNPEKRIKIIIVNDTLGF